MMTSAKSGNIAAVGGKTGSVQMNVRLSSDLKARGDAVFEMLGMSATQAVRMFYEFAASCKGNPDRLIEAVKVEDPVVEAERQERIRQRREIVERGANLYWKALEALGVEELGQREDSLSKLPYKELREIAYLEKYGMM